MAKLEQYHSQLTSKYEKNTVRWVESSSENFLNTTNIEKLNVYKYCDPENLIIFLKIFDSIHQQSILIIARSGSLRRRLKARFVTISISKILNKDNAIMPHLFPNLKFHYRLSSYPLFRQHPTDNQHRNRSAKQKLPSKELQRSTRSQPEPSSHR